MIGYLRGTIFKISSSHIILDVSGVGYLVSVTHSYALARNIGETVSLYIETIVREDSLSLYGFDSESEKDLFNLLTTVKGVGSKVALAILSNFDPATITNILISEDTNSLSSISGIGPKLATRIVTELKDKKSLGNIEISSIVQKQTTKNNFINDAMSALTNLGYSRSEALGAINKIEAANEKSVNKLITEALKELSA